MGHSGVTHIIGNWRRTATYPLVPEAWVIVVLDDEGMLENAAAAVDTPHICTNRGT